jgi:hypothetical protein
VELWQLVLALVMCIPGGMALGILTCYGYFRLIRKIPLHLKSVAYVLIGLPLVPQRTLAFATGGAQPQVEMGTNMVLEFRAEAEPIREEAQPRVEVATIDEVKETKTTSLVKECEINRQILKKSEDQNFAPLRTDYWTMHRKELANLPQEFQKKIEDLYIDINLLNQIVWIITEFGRKSPDILNQYNSLKQIILSRLDDMKIA